MRGGIRLKIVYMHRKVFVKEVGNQQGSEITTAYKFT